MITSACPPEHNVGIRDMGNTRPSRVDTHNRSTLQQRVVVLLNVIGVPSLFMEIDTIQITNSTVTYSELGVKKEHSGTIEINQINGDIVGITNISEFSNEPAFMPTVSLINLLAELPMPYAVIVETGFG